MPIPVLTVAQMREWEESSWASGRSPDKVIAQVGRMVAEQLLQLCAPKQRILILAGKGNNGADARATLQHVMARTPSLIDVTDPEAALPRLREALSANPDLIVDGLFGIGLNRPLSAAWAQLIECLNASHSQIVAVDVPSGLNADTGLPEGAAVRASCTITLGAPKIGFLQEPAAPFVGKLIVFPEIGLAPMPAFDSALFWTSSRDFQDYPPRRAISGHKGDFGHAVLLTGSVGYHGAAVLTAKGAQRAQPGLVTVVTQPGAYVPVASQLQAAMARPWRPGQELPPKTTALLCGPGLAQPEHLDEIRDEFQKNWSELAIPMIADASSLDWLPAETGGSRGVRVITPHPGEAARALKWDVSEVQNDRVRALRALSEKYGGCWVVLKGRMTLIGQASGAIWVNSSGNPQLAQGGSGDLLAGFITGLLAQPALAQDPAKALAYAIWMHGHAADYLTATRPNWTVEELSAQLGLRANL